MAVSTLAPTAAESDRPYPARRDNHLLIADLGPEEVASARQTGALVYEDIRFEEVVQHPLLRGRGPGWAYWEPQAATLTPAVTHLTQADVMRHIDAPAAWEITRGAGVTIAIVDTGIAGGRAEFPPQKRSARSVSFAFANPWQDVKGHGSMCASAAAATTQAGGRFDGVAPDAQLLSARTTLFSTDLYKTGVSRFRGGGLGWSAGRRDMSP